MKTETLNQCIGCLSSTISQIDALSDLYKCETCNLVFNNPRPTIEEVISYYSKPQKYTSWLAVEKARELMWKRRIAKMKQYLTGGNKKILDIGAGTAQFLHLLKDYTPNLYGTEISESAVSIASQKYNLTLYKGEIEKIDFKGRHFDIITLFHLLEHVPFPIDTLKKCHELLVPGGIVIVAVPNELTSFKFLLKNILRILGVGKFKIGSKYFIPKISLDGSIDEIHFSHFTVKSLTNLFTRVGFSVIEITPDPYFAFLGLRMYFELVYLACVTFLNRLVNRNLYDTTWVVARKKSQ